MNKETELLFEEDYKETIRVAFVKSGISIESLAETTGLSGQGVRNVLNGKGSHWRLHEVCGIIGVEIDSILKGGA